MNDVSKIVKYDVTRKFVVSFVFADDNAFLDHLYDGLNGICEEFQEDEISQRGYGGLDEWAHVNGANVRLLKAELIDGNWHVTLEVS